MFLFLSSQASDLIHAIFHRGSPNFRRFQNTVLNRIQTLNQIRSMEFLALVASADKLCRCGDYKDIQKRVVQGAQIAIRPARKMIIWYTRHQLHLLGPLGETCSS
jgi:hypothetical protein